MKIRAIVAMTLALGSVSVGVQAETLKVTDLDVENLWVQGSVEVQVTQGDATELLVRGDQDDLEKHPFFTRKKTLVLGESEQYRGERFSSVQYMLTVPDLDEIRLSGSGDVFVKHFETDSMLVNVEGSGDIKLFSLVAEKATVRVTGSGDIKLAELSAPIIELLVSGSGDVAIGKLTGDVIEATISGSGDISAEKSPASASSVEITIVGGGEVNFSSLATTAAEINIIGSGDARVGEVEGLEIGRAHV